ncbi:MAG: hypothetical protein OQK82_01740 [Candidatus Pacearchaeota archaeon]|nr:hypothetical protein [Candidatus Pacearchaeota archaeon]
MKTWKIIYYSIFLFLVLNILLLHLAKIVQADYVTVLLLLLLLSIVLFVPNLRKIKWGEFEAEIDYDQVKKVEKKMENLPEIEEEKSDTPRKTYADTVYEEIYSVSKTDHILALAKLRIELERILGKIVSFHSPNNKKLGLFRFIMFLEDNNILDKSYISPLKDIIGMCNRAIHGEEVRKDIAYSIIDIGVDLLERLYEEYEDLVIKPLERKVINLEDVEKHLESKYEVMTIVPTLEKPSMNKYIFTQGELDNFLENYGDYAEFLISIKKI